MSVWTPPTTRPTGLLVTPVIWNTDVVENLKALGSSTSAVTTTGTVTSLPIPSGRGDLVINLFNASPLTIQGIAAGYDGQRLTIINSGNSPAYLEHESASAASAERLVNMATSSPMPLAFGASGGVAEYFYHSAVARWRMVSHDQGPWLTWPFSAGDYTASVGGWTVDGADVQHMHYYLRGRVLTVHFVLVNTSVITGGGSLRISNQVWGGFTSVNETQWACRGSDAGSAFTMTRMATVAAGGTWINLYADATAAGWTAGVNSTTIIGHSFFEVI